MNDIVSSVPRATTIASYQKIEAGLAALRSKYQNAVFDCTTTKGMAEARAARGELRSTRVTLEKTRVEEKADALAYGRLVDSEAKRITQVIEALEEPIAAQVRAEDERKAQEKADAERAEQQRIWGIRQSIDKIRQSAICTGMSAVAIMERINHVASVIVTPEGFGELADEAIAARRATLETLATACSAQEQMEAQAEENARVGRELAARQAELDRVAAEQAAEAKRQQDAAAALEATRIAQEMEAQAAAQRERDAEAERVRLAQAEADRVAQAEREAAAARQRAERDAAEKVNREKEIAGARYRTPNDALREILYQARNFSVPLVDRMKEIEIIAEANFVPEASDVKAAA